MRNEGLCAIWMQSHKPVAELIVSGSLAPECQYSPIIIMSMHNVLNTQNTISVCVRCEADLEGDVLEQSVFQYRLHFTVHLHRKFKIHIMTVISSPREDRGHDSRPAGMAHFVLITGGRGQCTSLFPHDEILDNSTMCSNKKTRKFCTQYVCPWCHITYFDFFLMSSVSWCEWFSKNSIFSSHRASSLFSEQIFSTSTRFSWSSTP